MTDERYQSDIPTAVIERKRSDYSREGNVESPEYRECELDGVVVGVRYYDSDGLLIKETPMRNGMTHGTEYHWYDGVLENAEPYVDGKMHGTCKQWDRDGTLLGTYEMVHGTGLDVWRGRNENDRVFVAEIHPQKDGQIHGFQTWWAEVDKVYEETHFVAGKKHGIQREWTKDRLDEGFPRFWVDDEPVDREEYERAAASDDTLPPLRSEDDEPFRDLPDGVEPRND